MGFFDKFKKKEQPIIKCAQCFIEVGETKYWKIDGKQYCQDCYNKKITLRNQNGVNLSEHRGFEMPVEDVFFVKNRGVVLCGKISSGVVCFGDIITVNGKEYKVIGIEMFRKLLDSAKEGDYIGLLIETFNPENFKRGDIVSALKKIEKPQNTFVCEKCKRELNIKYLHNNNTCAECFSANNDEGKFKKTTEIKQENKNTELTSNISNVVFWRVLVQEKKQSIHMNSVPVQRAIYKLLRSTFPSLDPFFLTMREDFDSLNDEIHTEQDVNRVLNILAQVCLRFNSGLHSMKEEAIEKYISNLNDEDLIMAYIGIEYYRDSVNRDNETLDKTLHITEKLLNHRSIVTYDYIKRAVCMSDTKEILRRRNNPYTCRDCKKVFAIEDFFVLPSLSGFLVCEECYKKNASKEFSENLFAGGIIVKIIDTHGIHGYAFSHGGRASIRAVAYNEKIGFFIVKQDMCDIGDGYYVLTLPNSINYNNIAEVLEYEKKCKYSEMIYGLFHPLLLYIQLKGEIQLDDIMIQKIENRKIM